MKMVRTWAVSVMLAALTFVALPAQQASPAAVMLEAAQQKASVEGDLRGAIKLYEQLVSTYGATDRPNAANALLRMAECYERLGDPQASRVLERVVSQYPDQSATAAAARARLASAMPRPLCEQCGDALGSISADGKLMLTPSPYLGSSGDRAGDLGILELATGKLTPLEIEGSGKDAAGVAITGVFSPDGRQVIYTWALEESAELRIVPRQPKGKMRVLASKDSYGIKMPLSWSTANSILAIAQNKDQTLDLISINATTGAFSRLKSMGFKVSPAPHIASFTADGSFVAYEQFATDPGVFTNTGRSAGYERQIHVMAVDGSSDVPITTGAGVKRYPVWTPNGSHVLYLSNVSGVWDLWAIPMKAGKPAGAANLVKKNLGGVMSLGVSSDGVYHFYEGRTGVFKTTVGVIGDQAATRVESFVGTLPAWSPDGTKVAISRPRAGSVSGMDVVVRTVVTGEERVYRKDDILAFPFLWLPDGSGLLVQVRDAPSQQFWYRLDLSAGTFTRLVQQRGNPEFWTHQNVRTVSGDGRTLFFGTYANQKDSQLDRITALDLQTGTYRNVVTLPLAKESLPMAAQDIALAASPDGKSLALLLYDHKNAWSRLAVVGVDGQGYRELLQKVDADTLRNKLVWSRDGRSIFFTTRTGKPDDDTHRIMRIAPTGGAPAAIGFDVVGLECFDVNRDGTRIAFSTLRPEGWGELVWALDVTSLLKGTR